MMKSVLFLFLVTILRLNDQSIPDIELYYQQILDSPEFVKAIEENPESICNESLLFLPSEDYDGRFNLLFRGKKVVRLEYPDTAFCPVLRFYLNEKKQKKITLTAQIIIPQSNKCEGLPGHGEGKCQTLKYIICTMEIKKAKSGVKVISVTVRQEISVSSFM